MATQTTYKVNFKIIDWMRGLAALYIVFNHSRGFLFSNSSIYLQHIAPRTHFSIWEKYNLLLMDHTDLGVEFVTLFFLLSGFSIAHSLYSNNDITAFYKRRAIRLYPPYLLGILWSIVAYLIIMWAAPAVFNNSESGHEALGSVFHHFLGIKALLSNLLYVPKYNYLTPQYWSLPFEVIFYLIIPWFVKRFKLYGIFTLLLFITGWLILGPYFMDDEKAPIIPQYFIDFNIFFVIGFLFYKYKDYILDHFKLGKWTSIFILLVMFEGMVIVKGYDLHEQPNKITSLIMVVFSFIMIFAALKYQVRIKFLEKIGAYSYTLYVTHAATIFLLKVLFYRLGQNFYEINLVYAWYLGIPTSLIVAYFLYFTAEHPSKLYLKKLRDKIKDKEKNNIPTNIPNIASALPNVPQ